MGGGGGWGSLVLVEGGPVRCYICYDKLLKQQQKIQIYGRKMNENAWALRNMQGGQVICY